MNNELYDAEATGEGGIPAVALAGALESPPAPVLVLAAVFCAAPAVAGGMRGV